MLVTDAPILRFLDSGNVIFCHFDWVLAEVCPARDRLRHQSATKMHSIALLDVSVIFCNDRTTK